jgi:hypothetical protein
MRTRSRWDRCIYNRAEDAAKFFADFFSDSARQVLLFAGAGFDPRSTRSAESLAKILMDRLTGIFVRENRPNPLADLKDRGDQSEKALKKLIPKSQVEEINIFDSDFAVIGGLQIIQVASRIDSSKFTDIIIDASALSTGITFPLTRYLLEKMRGSHVNLHLLVSASPQIDERITAVPQEAASMAHGFKGGLGLFESKDACKLWLPQLVPQQGTVLSKIYSFVSPDLVCPILPFPSKNCRLVDELLEEYAGDLSNWNVDNRNFVFAAEDDPLDLYRSILLIDASRSRIFRDIGGAKTVISPIGSKLLAIGSLMAAIEKDFPVVYVESISYKMQPPLPEDVTDELDVVHLWLHGEAYSADKNIES